MKILAIGTDPTQKFLVVENAGMYYAINGNDGIRIERPDSAYKFGNYKDYEGELSPARITAIQKVVDDVGDDLPNWYREEISD